MVSFTLSKKKSFKKELLLYLIVCKPMIRFGSLHVREKRSSQSFTLSQKRKVRLFRNEISRIVRHDYKAEN